MRWAAFVLLLSTTAAAAQGYSMCDVDRATYNQLRPGMTLGQVVGIIRCPGSELSGTETMGMRTVMYMWDGKGEVGANMNAIFQERNLEMKLVTKAQSGLE